MLRKIIGAAALIVVLAGPAYSQGINLLPGDRKVSPEELERDRAIEREYKATTSKIPDKKGPVDPWGNVRSNPSQPATAGKQRQQ